MRTLKDVTEGEKVRVISVNGDRPLRRRLMDMGILKGCEIEVIRVAPLGDPVEFMLRGYKLTLRKKDAEMVMVETV
ncbi:MAG: ferrous iron transport protein A [Thermoplasmatales archaeon]|jgi:ferrous iron transport protein A|nr:ferrous iron transport protein A [Thermoplasmatales archaeon]